MRRTFEQFLAVFNSLSPSQRITFAAIAVLVPIGFLAIAWNGTSGSMIPLSYGKVFSLDEMRNAEQALKEAGLNKFRSDGRQILAPVVDVEKYNAALLQSGSLPSHWAEELEKKLESTNPFMTSTETLKQTREALLGKHLRRMILASPDFEDADVFWTPVGSSRSRKEGRMKATVVVRPRKGKDLSSRQVQALRDAVTFAIPDLKATDVTVYDQSKGESHTPDAENDPLNGKVLALLRDAAHMYETRIKNALVHLSPDIVVTVNVEIDPLQKSISQSVKYDVKKSIDQQVTEQKRSEKFRQQPYRAEPGPVANLPRALTNVPGNTQDRTVQDDSTTTVRIPAGESVYTELVPTLPKVVTVSVLIPEDYFAKALEVQTGGAATKTTEPAKTIEKIREETKLAVKNTVESAIPGGDAKRITVDSFVPVREEIPEIKTSTFEIVTSLTTQWGGPVALALFALWAVWLLRGTAPRSTSPEPMPATLVAAATGAAPARKEKEEVFVEEEPIPTLNDRDLVQNMVRDNPEMAVAIIGKWLQVTR